MPDIHEKTLDAIADLTEDLGQMLQTGAKAMSLTPVRCAVIFELHENGPMRQIRLGEQLAMSPQQLAVLVDALVERDLLVRTPDPTDRRAVLVHLTDGGNQVARQIAESRTGIAHRLLDHIPESELVVLQDLIQRVLQRTRELRD